ncbi:MAG TPA: LysM peptidoglycan-binding domain-containing protein [Longimicrobium sp.]|jgi:LysM repeat protein|uniref:LysM peptidoglycan-binding domain-containing protein n=1 Tax=Longimicrobium sp. TaxID=2029185 RepID=UPI002ED9E564
MRRLPLLLLVLSCAAADAAAQAAPSTRRPPADTVRIGRAAADSIRMAEEGEVVSIDALEEEEAPAAADTVPVSADGPYARAAGTGPFTVQASGEPAPRPARSEVVWVNAAPARPAASDTARAGTGARVASGSTTRRDTASTARPAARDTARTGQGQRVPSGSTTRRDTASASRPAARDTARTGQGQRVASGSTARRDTAASTTRRAPRDTVTVRRNDAGASTGGRTGSSTSTTTSGRTGSSASTTTGGRAGSGASTTTGGRTGSNTSTSATSGRAGASTSTPATSRPRAHTVATGETFYGIARRYGVTAAQLRALNPDVDMNELEVGDVLRLPAGARDSRAPAQPARTGTGTPARPSTAPTQPRGGRTHTVAQGETLFGIARRYGVTVAALREANEMESDQVRTGQRLVIPPAR